MASMSSWSSPPKVFTLERDEVHVWRAALDEWESLTDLWQTLTTDEQTRANSFYFPKDRDRFIAARGILRAILSRYVGSEPRDLRFCYNPYGKPALIQAQTENILHFNVSHSNRLALYAIGHNRAVGIDLEYMRSDFPWEQIAESYFSAQENAILRALPAPLKQQAFFNGWTRKEAYLKAVGQGLQIPLNQFDVSLIPGEPAKLLHTHWNCQETSRWSLQELLPAPDYAAALAVAGTHWQLKLWQWSSSRLNAATGE